MSRKQSLTNHEVMHISYDYMEIKQCIGCDACVKNTRSVASHCEAVFFVLSDNDKMFLALEPPGSFLLSHTM